MKSDLAESIRSTLITQALIVVLCVTFTNNRHSQRAALDEIETLYVSYRLLTATVGDVRNSDTDDKAAAPDGMAKDLENNMLKDAATLEVDALAAFLSSAKPSYHPPSHRVPLPSGGWLRFHADPASFKELAPPPAGSKVPLYEMTLVATEDADLHRPDDLRITVTNAEKSLHPATKAEIWESMRPRATVPGEPEPMGATDIENRIRIRAHPWSSATGGVDGLYADSRYSFETEQITVPVISMQVSATLALVALTIVSTALAAQCSHQCRIKAAKSGEPAAHEGFLILRPIDGTVPPGWWHQVLAHVEIWFVQPPYWIGLLGPSVCAGLLAIAHKDIAGSWVGWVLLPFGVAYTWMLAKQVVGVSWTRTPAPEAAAAEA